jgi:hypothetical protein
LIRIQLAENCPDPSRKEVKNMTYQKPEIAVAGPAVRAIQGTKPVGAYWDMNPGKHQTVAAYEADE